jgi:hypothetical protein
VRSKPVQKLNRITLLKVAAFSEVDPRTVDDYLAGRRKTCHQNAEAIRRALATLNIEDPHAATVSP